jgi:predicted dehydrogenase
MTDAVRTGVIGTGNMGRHHVRVYAAHSGAELVGVSDADDARAAAVAGDYDTRALGQDALLDRVDAVSVAVPTPHHFEVARRAIDRGVAVLVEKPLAATVAEGEQLVAAARTAGVPLAVGHVERFNPAVQELFDDVAAENVVAVEARRLGPPREGMTGSVISDLMIHDLDILVGLFGDDVRSVEAATGRSGQYATAVLTFDSGVVGTLTASRTTQRKVRRLSVTTERRHVLVDYLDQSVRVYSGSDPAYVEDDDGVQHRDETVVERPAVESAEPLRHELDAFLTAVRTGSDPPVSGNDGLRALRLTERVADAADTVPEVRL